MVGNDRSKRGGSDADADRYSHLHADANTDPHAKTDPHSKAEADSQANAHTEGDSDPELNRAPKGETEAKTDRF